MASASRIRRWTGQDVFVRDPEANDAPLAATPLSMGSASASEVAAPPAPSSRTRAILEILFGTVGLAGLVGLVGSIDHAPVHLAAAGGMALAAALPLASSLRTVFAEQVRLRAMSTASEVDTVVSAHGIGQRVADHGNVTDHGNVAPHARRHARVKPSHDRIAVTTEDGLTTIAHVVDVSLAGAAIAGPFADVRIGDLIRVGSREARVVRAFARGIACEFVEPLLASEFGADIVL